MKAYLTTTGLIFALLVLAHIARAIAEGRHVFGDPFFVVSTVVAAAMSGWAWRLRRQA